MQRLNGIVVLGAGILDGGLPRWGALRLEHALAVRNGLKAEVKMILSGGPTAVDVETTEAELMAEYLRSRGVSEQEVELELECESRDTLENATFVWQRHLRGREWDRIIVVTSAFHVQRAQWMFAKVLGDQITRVPIQFDPSPNGDPAVMPGLAAVLQAERDLCRLIGIGG